LCQIIIDAIISIALAIIKTILIVLNVRIILCVSNTSIHNVNLRRRFLNSCWSTHASWDVVLL